jgi:hypothetical protein
LPSGTGYALAASWGQSGTSSDLFARGLFTPPGPLTTASFDGNAGLSEYLNASSTPVSGNVGSAQIVEIGYAGPVGWGRWTAGGATVGLNAGGSTFVNLTGSSSHHYIIGVPTAVMPTNPATYSLVGATSPTLASGSGAPGTLNSANMSADFAAGRISLNMDMTVNGNNYVTSNLPMTLGNAPNNFTFSGGGITTSSNCISASCFTSVEGFFAGDDASNAGLAYETDISGTDAINGTAAFKKD